MGDEFDPLLGRQRALSPALRLAAADGPRVRLEDAAGGPGRAVLTVLEPDVVRVQWLPRGRAELARTWAVVGAAGDCAPEGRDREDLAGFSCPEFRLDARDGELRLRTGRLELRVTLVPFALAWHLPGGEPLVRDHPLRGYAPGECDTLRHTLVRHPDEVYLGLGEASGPLDRHHRRYRLRPTDALGYDAERSDPLYKHLPIVLTLTPEGHASGVLYDTAALVTVDLGCEIDNYHGPFRYLEVDAPELDYYLLAGPELRTVVRRLQDLTGYAPLPPRWTLGYLGSTMHYTDAEDPAAAFAGFVAKLAEHRIPCSGFHLSSGYSLADDGRRYVFEWNRRRVPDPAAAVAVLEGAGIRTAANIKPALLTSHPDYPDLARAGAFVRAGPTGGDRERGDRGGGERGDHGSDGLPPGAPFVGPFWGGDASHLDFTRPEGYDWWRARVRERLLEVGVSATWNDNNEYQIFHPDARCAAGPLRWLRPVQTLLMNRASRDAQREHHPDRRDWLLTRSGMPGTQRYAHTWSGDNRTSWHALAYNLPMGLNLSLCGWAQHGHDVGGFAGPAPDAELLVRWVQHGVLMPRFCIHSWNDDGTVTEPWMHPEATPLVRDLVRFRERLLPYLYTLAWDAASRGEPITRPLAYAFQGWPPGWRESFVHLLGPALLVAPVLEPGARERTLRLPPGRWLELVTGRVWSGGAEATLEAPLAMPALLLREGHALPLLHPVHHEPATPKAAEADEAVAASASAGAPTPASDLVRGGAPWGAGGGVQWLGLPDTDGAVRGRMRWDDGLTRAYERGRVDRFELHAELRGAPPEERVEGRVWVRSLASGMGAPRMELLLPALGAAHAAPGDPRVPGWRGRWRVTPLPLDPVG